MKFRPPARLRRLLRTQEFLALCDDTTRDIQSRIRWDEQSGDSRQSARTDAAAPRASSRVSLSCHLGNSNRSPAASPAV